MSHTYAICEISKGAWGEIAAKLRDAGYDHAFMDDGCIDMHGIAVKAESVTHNPKSTTPAPAAPDTRVEDGKVPDRETFWLVERNISPPQYVSTNSAGWHYDVWEARRFQTEREAHDYWRRMGALERAQFKVVEHLFTNKIGDALPPSPAPLPTTEDTNELVARIEAQIRKYQP